MTDRFPDAQLDLSLLPAPAVIKDLSFDTIKAERLAELHARYTAAGLDVSTLMLESEPNVILQEEDAFRELLDLQDINDACRAVMILYARKTDQDVLYALLGIRRRVLVPAAAGKPALMESDDDFMLRAQIALDGSAPGLTGGGYASVALRAAPEIKRVSLVRGPEGSGQVSVVLQGRATALGTTVTTPAAGGTAMTWVPDMSVPNRDGSVSDAAVRAVAQALADDWSDDEGTGSQLTDLPMVRSAKPRPYDVVLRATLPSGPAYALVQAESMTGLLATVGAAQLVANSVTTDALMAAGRIPSMTKAWLDSPSADVVCAADEVPWCRSATVMVTVDG